MVLAGGEGTRLRPLTNTRPKPLLPVLGRPCVEYALHSLVRAGVGRIYIACGYGAIEFVKAFGDASGFDAELVFAFEEEPAGTAGAVKLLEEVLEGTFIVVSGDVLADVDVARLVDYHSDKGATATIALTEVERPEEFGIVGLDDEGRVMRFKEKPATDEVFSRLINAGIYVLEREVLDLIPRGRMFDFSKDLFPLLLRRGRPMYGIPLTGIWKDIGRPEDLLEVNLLMAGRRGVEIEVDGAQVSGVISGALPEAGGAVLDGPLHFGVGVRISNGSRLTRSVLGAMVEVGEGTAIEGSLLLDNCIVGSGCIISGSVLGEGCVIGRDARLIDAVLGDGVVVWRGEELLGVRRG